MHRITKQDRTRAKRAEIFSFSNKKNYRKSFRTSEQKIGKSAYFPFVFPWLFEFIRHFPWLSRDFSRLIKFPDFSLTSRFSRTGGHPARQARGRAGMHTPRQARGRAGKQRPRQARGRAGKQETATGQGPCREGRRGPWGPRKKKSKINWKQAKAHCSLEQTEREGSQKSYKRKTAIIG